MNTYRLLLCTDMDRTIIPNGRHPEHPEARPQFRRLCRLPEVTLVYVTGRHLQLMREAIETYELPEPDYAITDVGTKIYQKLNGRWSELLLWQEAIAADWRGKSHDQLQVGLSGVPELILQEQSKQNDHKLSYYLSLEADHDKVLQEVADLLAGLGVAVSLTYSIDEPGQTGLLDILPESATKLYAIEFLQQNLGFQWEETLFCGDSGNDLSVMESHIRSVLVANAEQDIKNQSLALVEKNNRRESLYLADQVSFSLGGNYSAGVLQGVSFFAPAIIEKLNIP